MIKRIRASLTVKLFLITMALLAVSCFLTYSFISWVMPKTYQSTLTEELNIAADELVAALEQVTYAECGPLLSEFVGKTNADLTILDAEGKQILYEDAPDIRVYFEGLFVGVGVVSDSDVAEDVSSAVSSEDGTGSVEESVVITTVTETDSSATFMTDQVVTTTLGYEFSFSDSPDRYTLVVSNSMQEVNEAAKALRQTLPLLILAVLAVSLLGGFFFSRYVTRPIVRISAISKQLAALDFTWECHLDRTDEIGVLARNLGELASRLSTALEELRGEMERERDLQRRRTELFSAVSHELKTPITIIKGQLEGMLGNVGAYADRDTYLARALTVAESMEGLVQEILSMTRMESVPAAREKKRLSLAEIVQSSLAAHAELLRQRSLSLVSSLDESLFLCGDPDELDKVVSNLLTNAMTHSPEGAEIRVRVGETEAKKIAFSVENTDAHIPEDVLPHLFEAFYRVDSSRNRKTGGSGLGLYLVQSILDRYDTSCHAENTAEGVRFHVDFDRFSD